MRRTDGRNDVDVAEMAWCTYCYTCAVASQGAGGRFTRCAGYEADHEGRSIPVHFSEGPELSLFSSWWAAARVDPPTARGRRGL